MIMLMSSKRLNPFRAGQCLSTFQMALKRKKSLCLNPFRAGRCLSTDACANRNSHTSQSLSSRAMSFDVNLIYQKYRSYLVSIPFEQGDVFRHKTGCAPRTIRVSIPFEQGDVFRPKSGTKNPNPCSSQSLSSRAMSFDENDKLNYYRIIVSIPFEQGDVFRRKMVMDKLQAIASQSLSSRAMSFDPFATL